MLTENCAVVESKGNGTKPSGIGQVIMVLLCTVAVVSRALFSITTAVAGIFVPCNSTEAPSVSVRGEMPEIRITREVVAVVVAVEEKIGRLEKRC